MQHSEHLLVESINRGRYALDERAGPDVTSGTPLEIRLGGKWIAGRVEYGTRRVVDDIYEFDRQTGYYFVATDGNICGLFVGMKVRKVGAQ